jgi:hypothetical protein
LWGDLHHACVHTAPDGKYRGQGGLRYQADALKSASALFQCDGYEDYRKLLKQPDITADVAIKSQELIMAIYQSAKENRTVRLHG